MSDTEDKILIRGLTFGGVNYGDVVSYKEYEQLKKDKAELVGALREAADDIVEYANSYNNDSSIYVTDAHNEADKYRAIAHAHANED